MTVRILFFAQYRELADRDHLDLEVPEGATVADVVGSVRGSSEDLGRLPAAPAVARNRVVVPLDTLVESGDELALLPPVAGG